MSLIRLQKALAEATKYSRRKAEEVIAQGRVTVNGKAVTEQGVKVDPSRDTITLDGQVLSERERMIYIMLNKPRGVICALSDPQGRPLVTDFMKGVREKVYPVGRLDLDSEGLILLTNDGAFTLKLTHPRYGVPKTYHALVKEAPTETKLNLLRQGVLLEDGPTAPATVAMLKSQGKKAWIEVTITEGRKRQVRRMLTAVGAQVLRLKRVAVGTLELKGLRQGSFRYLRPAEVRELIWASERARARKAAR